MYNTPAHVPLIRWKLVQHSPLKNKILLTLICKWCQFFFTTYLYIYYTLSIETRYHGCHINNSSMKYESIRCNIFDTKGFGYISVLYKHFAFFNILHYRFVFAMNEDILSVRTCHTISLYIPFVYTGSFTCRFCI